jgi:predicted AlkP superfamily phosphohydrolase/phosphomutase
MPLIVWALDSADLDLMRRWIGDGSLPNIAELWKRSLVAPVAGPAWFDEIGTWITAFSGVPPTQHGYTCARRLKPGTYTLERARLTDAMARPCWEEMRDPNFRALIWEPSEGAPSPNLAGLQVYNVTTHQEAYSIEPPVTVPESFLDKLRNKLGNQKRLRFNRFQKPTAYYQDQLQENLSLMARKGRILRDLVREGEYDLIVIGFNELHDAAHILWPFMDGRSPERDPKGELADGVRSIYQHVDREIGAIMELLPAGATVCLLSMYGLKDQYPILGLTEDFMRRLGYQIPNSSPDSRPGLTGIVRQLLPESLRFEISKRLPSDTQQRLLHSSFASSTDFARSRAFVIPSSLFCSYIRVNLKGREPAGAVAAGREYDALLDEIESDLRQLIDPKTGEPAVSEIRRSAGFYIDGPSEWLPDLFVHWKEARHFLDRAIHPRAEIRQAPPGFFRDSFHRKPGFAAISGRGIQPTVGPEACVLDIAPTLLDLMGGRAASFMPGTSLLAPVSHS